MYIYYTKPPSRRAGVRVCEPREKAHVLQSRNTGAARVARPLNANEPRSSLRVYGKSILDLAALQCASLRIGR